MDVERRVLRPAGFVPVEAKLRPTLRREGLVLRGELVDRLLEARDVPVVLVTAPAGYGKTVLVDQWSDEDDRPFTWLCLDEADNDPVVLITYLMLALQRVEAVDAAILRVLADNEELLSDTVLPRLGAMLRERQRPFVFVLDDVDALTSGAADEVVAAVAENLPGGSQLVLVGRTGPSLDWEGMRARGRLLELGAAELRLSRAEALAVLKESGLHVTDGDVDRLLERTEGWAAGVYLTTQSRSARGVVQPAGDGVPGDDVVAGYVRDQVLASVTREDRMFLMRSSLLSEMSGSLCDAVLATTGSDDTLRRLSASNLLVERVDGEVFRMHRLLAESLRADLLREEPQMARLLHSRACRWLEAHGEPDGAIDHAIAAGEVDRAARLIWSRVPACLGAGRLSQLEGWLESFTARQIAGQAKLALTAAACTLQRGGSPDHWVTSAEHGDYETSRAGESASVEGATALLRSVLARNGVVQMGADARLAAKLLAPDDPWLCSVHLVAAISTYLAGDPATAVLELANVERYAQPVGAHQCAALALTQQALIALDNGDWNRARDLAERAQTANDEHRLGGLMTLLPLQCLRVYLAARDSLPVEAEEGARRCMARLAVLMHPPAWLGVQCRELLARAELALGDQVAARVLLSEAQTVLSDVPDAVVLRDAVAATWEQVEALPLEIRGGASTLTTAELRVLQFLPTHLSFEEIGRQLFVSRNTVKTQAVAAYRKLGVSSRAEAVERANALGLLAR